MENKNGQGIFYGVIGVATLIVAIIGATFAYFTASATNNTTITGTTGSANLTLTVTHESTSATGSLVPQKVAGLGTAVSSANGCVDGHGNTVCHVYKIHVANTGSSLVALTGTLTLDKGGATHLNWGIMESATSLGTGFAAASSNALGSPTLAATTGQQDYYVVVWLEETDSAQPDDAGKTFTGTVSFVSADGGTGVTSTFTS